MGLSWPWLFVCHSDTRMKLKGQELKREVDSVSWEKKRDKEERREKAAGARELRGCYSLKEPLEVLLY